jgi:hypothetical protein
MAAKILACISTNNATVAQWRRGRLKDLRRFHRRSVAARPPEGFASLL